MDKHEIIKDISKRTNGDIYLGVVGAVRTGKSTFIKRFIENLVVPNIDDEFERKRYLDEIPQTAQGKTIMTIEPKFVPSNAATIKIDDFKAKIRLIDCVGYVIDAAKGYEDENGPRMVKTPWYDDEIPFIEAAEIGTEKVIKEHSSIGIVVTTDGSIGDIKRDEYIEAEEKIVNELKEIGKPFIVVLNTLYPKSDKVSLLKEDLIKKYDVPVIPVSCDSMNEKEIYDILKEALYEFPIIGVNVNMPDWIASLNPDHKVKKEYIDKIKESVVDVDKVRDVDKIIDHFNNATFISKSYLSSVDTSKGEVTINLEAPEGLYNEVLNEIIGTNIDSKAKLISLFQDYNTIKEEYSEYSEAINMVKKTGYSTSFPSIKDMKLENPEIIRQGTRYGVKLKAVAPSIHMIRVDVESTFEPIIGSEEQSKELIDSIMKDFKTDPKAVWKSEMFGRSLDNIVKEGIRGKLALMPDNIRAKLKTTLTKVVNKGSSNMIAIVL